MLEAGVDREVCPLNLAPTASTAVAMAIGDALAAVWMERRGISIDRQVLSRLSGDFAQTAARVEAEIQEIAGEPINVGSPKQLGDIIFDLSHCLVGFSCTDKVIMVNYG